MFIVMCRVSGGITGTRQGQLKSNGEPVFFATWKEAQDKATELNNVLRPYSTADFKYWPEEV